jgi:hypothetical protein
MAGAVLQQLGQVRPDIGSLKIGGAVVEAHPGHEVPAVQAPHPVVEVFSRSALVPPFHP